MAYKWKFSRIGGVTRVNIETGEDIAHLAELDQKMWSVLSCPVKGLELDERTLTLMDLDNDGKIRVNEVVDAIEWLKKVLNDLNDLTRKESVLKLSAINQTTDEGKIIYKSARQILSNLGLEKDSISIDDTSDNTAIFAKTKFNGDGIITEDSTDDEKLKQIIRWCIETIGSSTDRSGNAGVNAEQIEAFFANCADYSAWLADADNNKDAVLPYCDNTEAAYNTVMALKDKVADYFVRCKMVAFNKSTHDALELSVERLNTISDKNLATYIDEIANYPLAKIDEKCELPLDGSVNPAWQAAFSKLKALVFDVDFAKKKSITEGEWLGIVAKFAPYEAWKAAKAGVAVESIGDDNIKAITAENKDALLELIQEDLKLETEAAEIESVDKLMHLYRDMFSFLQNFVTFSDFYSRKEDRKAVFQAGSLYIDQRCCDLCIKVSDMPKHNAMSNLSGIYLVYCDCTSKVKNETMTIAAAITDGDVDNIMVGKNAIFYDRNGLDWDATVTKIVDNPISIRQAFWSPYKKFGRFISDQVKKFAESKDNKVTEQATSTIGETGTNIAEAPAAAKDPLLKDKKQAFDIAKFCGIFAAIGLAIGAIGGFLASVCEGFFSLKWWGMILAVIGFMLIISGPSMFLAWLKLRKRNLSPVLNANGWAVNAQTYINILFGATLTSIAKFPTLKVADPFAKKKSKWRFVLYALILLIIIFAILFFTNRLSHWGLPYKGSVIDDFFSNFSVVDESAVETTTDAAVTPEPPAE
ncbi:MAG: hypothetical protein J6Y82_00685 [Bacteroidales bacterium]|nr:hypothetical protein [Bacteroidales bacterium]